MRVIKNADEIVCVLHFFHILRNLIQAAVQSLAQLVERFCFHVVVCPESPDGFAVNPTPFPKLIGSHLLALHGLPKPVEFNHVPIPLDTLYYGGYNPFY